jgi:F-type H+-transporting ATPase subunit gamma
MMQTLRVEKLLPLDRSAFGEEQKGVPHTSANNLVDYIYEQPAQDIFNKLVPRYVEMQIFRMLAESSAAEHAARMTAMDSATRNASELIDKLTLKMNNIRQAAITKELIEIVSGASSANS